MPRGAPSSTPAAAPLPDEHGALLRAIVPGWYATGSVKWLTSVDVTTGSYDGPFEILDYCLPDATAPGGLRRMAVMAVHGIGASLLHGKR